MPKVYPVSQTVNEASTDLGFLRLAEKSWSKLEDISIDYTIMENPGNCFMLLMKVQIGIYLDEDDIIHYKDVYARN